MKFSEKYYKDLIAYSNYVYSAKKIELLKIKEVNFYGLNLIENYGKVVDSNTFYSEISKLSALSFFRFFIFSEFSPFSNFPNFREKLRFPTFSNRNLIIFNCTNKFYIFTIPVLYIKRS